MTLGVRAGFALAIIAALVGCDRPAPPLGGVRIDGPYMLVGDVVMVETGKLICYQKFTGGCDQRIAAPVVELGWDDDFIAAAVRKVGAPDERDYYYIVRDFDGPRADPARAVKGPFSEEKFVDERRKHGVPGVAPLASDG
ncbi:MAG: hypothetical protein A3E78_06320 [Alphaproteobacteria bacterium RIFCSPHIGHO2_12_FULL_63_12]|nr:MAG: hypothetical protein A3E78_06320 [Alphaproteobacteria bacterium RIFCSPHIGHO2_12_FULL_63_12]